MQSRRPIPTTEGDENFLQYYPTGRRYLSVMRVNEEIARSLQRPLKWPLNNNGTMWRLRENMRNTQELTQSPLIAVTVFFRV